MATTSTISSICQIAEDFARDQGLAEFEIDRVVHAKEAGRDEWIIHLRFVELDSTIEDDGHGAIVVVDAATEKPRLVEGL